MAHPPGNPPGNPNGKPHGNPHGKPHGNSQDTWQAPPATLTLEAHTPHVWRVALQQAGDAAAADSIAADSIAADSIAADAAAADAAGLSDDERARAARFVFARDRRRFVAARAALRRILAAYLGVEAHTLRFATGAYGKPALAGHVDGSGLCFNLAHSGEQALVAVGWDRPLGVDLELLRDDLDFLPLLEQLFTAREQAAIAGLPRTQARAAFFRAWVCKEAFIKAIGMGFSFPPTQVELQPATAGGIALQVVGGATAAAAGSWQLTLLDAGPGYAAALVARDAHAPPRLFDLAPPT